MNSLPEHTDVLVVGAGPTGASLGAYLARQGIDVVVIDKKEQAEQHSKAGNLWPRTLELLGGMIPEAIERIMPKSAPLKTLSIYAYGSHMVDAPNDQFDSPYPAAIINGQDVIEGSLWETLVAFNKPVHNNTAFLEGTQHESHVEALLSSNGSEHAIKARYVVGCDAGRSKVRKSAGLDFEPDVLPGIHFLLMDADLHWNRTSDRDRMWMYFYDHGYYGVAPCYGGHHHLWCFEMLNKPFDRDPTVEEMRDRLRAVTKDSSIKLSNVKWRSHVHEPRTGIAPGFRAGRYFLAGDAAHIALPVGGKGMNSGIQDALALGWRLATVLKVKANDPLLDSYATERLHIRKDLKAYQLKGMYEMVDPGIMQKIGMKFIAPFMTKVMGSAEFQGQNDPAMLKITYPESSLVVSNIATKKIKAGSRAPDATVNLRGGEGLRLHSLCYGSLNWTALVFDGKKSIKKGSEVISLCRKLFAKPDLNPYAILGGEITQKKPEFIDKIWQSKGSILYDLDHFAHSAYGISTPIIILIRPDGYIAYLGPVDENKFLKFWEHVAIGN